MLRLRTRAYLLVLGLSVPAGLRAQAPAAQAPTTPPPTSASAAPSSEYDQLVLHALQAFEQGRWDEARRLFERAHDLEPTARTLRTIGMAAFNQGDFLAALQNLEAALADARKPLTEEQRSHVTDLITRANQQVGRFRLRIEPAGTSLLVDGKSPVLIAESELVLLPGRHELVLSAPGHRELARPLIVEAQDRALLELVLEAHSSMPATADSSAQPAAPAASAIAGATTRPAAEERSDPGRGRADWGIVALSIGAAGLVGAGVVTLLALDERDALEEACPNRRCPPSEHDRVADYDLLRITAGIALGVGIAGAAVGTLLLVSGGSVEEPGSATLELEPLFGPGFAGVRGRL